MGYHLGDFALCNAQREREIATQLNGIKFLILGNHDRKNLTRYRDLGFEPLERLDKGDYILTHKPLPNEEVPKGKTNVHGHTHNILHPELVRHICVSVELTSYRPIKLI